MCQQVPRNNKNENNNSDLATTSAEAMKTTRGWLSSELTPPEDSWAATESTSTSIYI